MTQEKFIINKLTATDGKILTDGKIYGTVIYLASDRSSDEFYEISQEEYDEIMLQETDN